MDVFDLEAVLKLNKTGFEADLDNAEKDASGFGSKLISGVGTGLKTLASVTGIAVGAATAFTGAIVKGVGNVAEYGDNIDKMSQKMGMSAEAYQEWDAVLQHSGTSIETMKASMKTLANAAETGNEAFAKLGITEEELATLNQEELFGRTIEALQNVESTTERTYLAGKVLGRGATELGALLNTSAEETQAMKDRVHELGGVMSDEAVKASAHFQDSLQDMTTAFAGLKRGMMSDFLPSITTVMDGLTELFAGNSDKGLALIDEGINNFISQLDTVLPKIIDSATSIINSLIVALPPLIQTLLPSLVNGFITLVNTLIPLLPDILSALSAVIPTIVDAIVTMLPLLIDTGLQILKELAFGIAKSLPTLIPTIVDIMLDIVETLIDNVDLLIDASIAIILGLTDGLIEALPKLIDRLPEIIIKIIDTLVKNAPKLIEAAIQIIVSLAKGLITNIPRLIAVIPQIIVAVVNGFKNLMSSYINIGSSIVEGIKNGLVGAWGRIIDWIRGKAGELVSTVKSFFGIHSPSTVFRDQVGKNLALGIGEGFADSIDDVKADMIDALNFDFPDINAPDIISDGLTQKVSVSNDVQASSVDKIITLLTDYLPQLANMQIVMDGKTVVGSTIGMIDDELGKISTRKVRFA